MKRRNAGLLLAAISMGILILDSKNAMIAASEGVQICIKTVVPSLFPFFVLSIFLTGTMGESALLRSVCSVFRIGKDTESVLISGLLGGYPVGAQAAAEGWRNGKWSQNTANHLLMFCSQAGPSFLFGMVAAQFPETKYGWMLWAVQLLSSWSVAQNVSFSEDNRPQHVQTKKISLAEAMKKAIQAMASVCGWVIIFRIVLRFLDRMTLWALPSFFKILISGLLELTNGCLMLSNISDLSARFILAAIMLNFGGICVLMQTVSVAQGLDLKYYIHGKLVQTSYAILYCLCFLGKFAALIPIAGIFLLFRSLNPRKNSSNPAMVGV